MLLPSQLAAMKLGCRWAPETAPGIAVGAALSQAAPGAYARGDVHRVTGQNTVIGDCVETAAANAVQTIMSRSVIPGIISDDYPPQLYETLTPWRPGVPGSDQGTDPMALFDWWRANPIGAFKLANLTRLDPAAEGSIRQAIVETGGVFLVVELSTDQQNQRVWMPTGQAGSWGGHAIWADEFDGALTWATSWGEATAIDRSYFTAPGFVLGAFRLDLARV